MNLILFIMISLLTYQISEHMKWIVGEGRVECLVTLTVSLLQSRYFTCSLTIRIYTEEKAKVVASVFIQFLAALAGLHLHNMLKRMNCTRMI